MAGWMPRPVFRIFCSSCSGLPEFFEILEVLRCIGDHGAAAHKDHGALRGIDQLRRLLKVSLPDVFVDLPAELHELPGIEARDQLAYRADTAA